MQNRKHSEDENQCLVCSHSQKYFTVSECNHAKVCLICSYKSRTVYSDNKCPFCAKINLEVIAFEYEKGMEVDFSKINKSDCYKDQNYEKNGILYIDINAKEEILEKTSFKCPIANCSKSLFEDFNSLSLHLNKEHRRYYCEICVKEGKRFLSEATLFTTTDLQDHYNNGELDNHFSVVAPIHPECQEI
jgi:hypothetical protein